MTPPPFHSAVAGCARSSGERLCHVHGGHQYPRAQQLHRSLLPRRLESVGARAGAHDFQPCRDVRAAQIRFHLKQDHKLLKELFDCINALAEGGSAWRFCCVGSVSL